MIKGVVAWPIATYSPLGVIATHCPFPAGRDVGSVNFVGELQGIERR